MMNFHGLAIIIAVKNGAPTIQSCLDSIQGVIASGASLYVFDAESTDDTRKLVLAACPQVHYYCENDGGLYFAWNNAINKVQEPYLFFLNCDDRLCSAKNLHALLELQRSNSNLIATGGKTRMERQDGAVRYAGAPVRQSWFITDMPLVTVATIYSVKYLRIASGFDTQFRISSDYDLALRLLKGHGPQAFAFLDLPIIHFSLDGMSNKLRSRAFREIRTILWRHYGLPALAAHMIWYAWDTVKRSLLSVYLKRQTA